MADLSLAYQQQSSINLNTLLKTQRTVILTGPAKVGKKYLVERLLTGGQKIPIVPAKKSLIEFILHLNFLLTKKEIPDIRVSFSPMPSMALSASVVQLLNCVIDRFRPNFTRPEEKAIKILNKMAGRLTLILPVLVDRDIDDDFYDFLTVTLPQSGRFRTILIMDSGVLADLNARGRRIPESVVHVSPNQDDFRANFEDLPSKERIDEIVALAGVDAGCYAGFYEYLKRDETIETADFFTSFFDSKIDVLEQDSPRAKLLADFLAFFESDFSKREIDYIYRTLETEERNDLEELIRKLLDSKILSAPENRSLYRFLIAEIKDLIRRRNDFKRCEYYQKIEKCVSELYPLDYRSRYFYARGAEDNDRSDEILFGWRIHLLRTVCNTNETSKFKYFDSELNAIFKKFQDAYAAYYNEEYKEACKPIKELLYGGKEYVGNEAKYLCALCLWKLPGSRQSANLYFSEILESNSLEWETGILTKLCLISVYVNNAVYIRDALINAKRFFKEIAETVPENQPGYEVIQSILKRKAAAILDSAEADRYLEEAYRYFNTDPPVFEGEYIMAACNYAANLLTLGSFKKARRLLLEALKSGYANKTRSFYLRNNLLLANWFLKEIKEEDLSQFADDLSNAGDVPLDVLIIPLTNVGSMLLSMNKREGAELLEKAMRFNKDSDDYYVYYYNSNMAVYSLINGQLSEAESHLKKGVSPALLKPFELQFFELRNKILAGLIEKGERYSYGDLTKLFRREYENFLITHDAGFYSTPYLFSDMQFWTEN